MPANHEMLCSICEAGPLVPETVENEVTYKGRTRSLPLLMSVCQDCGSEQASAQQARDNKRAMLAFRKEVDGLLTGAELRVLRERLSISQAQAARLFGGGPVAFSKYENDDVAQSEAMDRLVRMSAEVPGALRWLAHRAGEPDLAGSASTQGFRDYLAAMERYAKSVSRLSRSIDIQHRYIEPRQVIRLTGINEDKDTWGQRESVLL
jgi:HTH-type transcriptional regulator/antitoxin MqsA